MMLPWQGYNDAPKNDDRFVTPLFNSRIQFEARTAYMANPDFAKLNLPVWEDLRIGTKLLLSRNVAIVLGEDCETPVRCVLSWTPNGLGQGGSGHAMRMARAHNIPVFDLALLRDQLKASEFIYDATSEYWGIPW